jgi:GxxExxY protein
MNKTPTSDLIFRETSSRIIAAVFEVHNVLGSGFLESVYQKALGKELRSRNLKAEEQKAIKVIYKRAEVGSFFADIVVNDDIIIELKSVEALSGMHEAQLLNYLKATGKKLGFIINFGRTKVECKRMIA